MSLPAELWARIFDLASDDDILLRPGIPTCLAESTWWLKTYLDHNGPTFLWGIRSPEMAMDILQRRSYSTKKAIVSTCRQWRQIGFESLFRCVYFSHVTKVVALCATLDSPSALATTATSSYGWWAKRIHIGPFISPGTNPSSIEEYQQSIMALIRHCPNVEIFIAERPLGTTFGPIMDALARYASRHLHTIHLNIPGESLSKMIWTLSALPRISAAHIHIETDVSSTDEVAHLGSAADLRLRLPYLQQISLRGYVDTLFEQLEGWDLPSLHSVTINNNTTQDPQDVVEFVKHHGSNLVLLDLNLRNPVDVPLILDLCPNLDTFAFNADWRITPFNNVATNIVNRPHQHITTVGLHGLCYAFGVGSRYIQATRNQTFEANYASRWNDLNMAALNKYNFPKLLRIRAVDRSVLEDLNEANGPSEKDGGYDRWSRWWSACANAGIRLEDCTGQLLGTLPDNTDGDEDSEEEEDEHVEDSEDEESEEDDDSDEDEEDDDDYEEEEEDDDDHPSGDNWRTGNILRVPDVLTQLIQEVKAMNETRDEALIASIRPDSPSDSES